MKRKKEIEISNYLHEEGFVKFSEIEEWVKSMLEANSILCFTQSTKDGMTEYFSIKTEDAIEIIKNYLGINFKRQFPSEYIAVKRKSPKKK